MDANEYQRQSMRTGNSNPSAQTRQAKLTNAALGLCGEAGEFADALKKHFFHDHELDRDLLAKELGDILWYAALACEALELSMSDVMQANIAKLAKRYPDGFDPERSRNREE